MESVRRFLHKRLKLIVNEAKSQVVKFSEASYLGFQILRGRVRWSAKARKEFKASIRGITGRTRGVSPRQVIEELTLDAGLVRGRVSAESQGPRLHRILSLLRAVMNFSVGCSYERFSKNRMILRRIGPDPHDGAPAHVEGERQRRVMETQNRGRAAFAQGGKAIGGGRSHAPIIQRSGWGQRPRIRMRAVKELMA